MQSYKKLIISYWRIATL